MNWLYVLLALFVIACVVGGGLLTLLCVSVSAMQRHIDDY